MREGLDLLSANNNVDLSENNKSPVWRFITSVIDILSK
jgi:hypothetical protein